MEPNALLDTYLHQLRLPTFVKNYSQFAADAVTEHPIMYQWHSPKEHQRYSATLHQAYSPTMYQRSSAKVYHFPTGLKPINLLAENQTARRNHVRKKAKANGHPRNDPAHP